LAHAGTHSELPSPNATHAEPLGQALEALQPWLQVPSVQDTPLAARISSMQNPELQLASDAQASPRATGASPVVGCEGDEQATSERGAARARQAQANVAENEGERAIFMVFRRARSVAEPTALGSAPFLLLVCATLPVVEPTGD
jgi:hypothetical protein